MVSNPTPFVRADEARWHQLTDGTLILPARVFLHRTRVAAIVVPRGKRKGGGIIVGEHPSSGFRGVMLDIHGRYAGSIRRAITKMPGDAPPAAEGEA
jgi:hypothetical protein